jgi:Family of unknown function (DUF6535)
VAAFLVESYKQLQPSSSDTVILLLSQISQQLAALSSGSSISIPSGLPGQNFQPSTSAVRVNILWFISLVLSLTCALLATLMQQWVRRYLQTSQRWYAPYKRARIRAFFAEGIERFGLPATVEALPALLHVSVFLFFAGLVDFLININHTVAFSLLSAVVVGTSAYFLFTVLPLIYPDSPYQTPLTSLLWIFQQTTLLISLDLLRRFVKFVYEHTGVVVWKLYGRILFKLDDHSRRLRQGLSRSRETIALRQPTEMDSRALSWTLDALDEDHELEQFVAAIPGYYRSTTVSPPREALGHLTHHERLDSPLEARILDLLSPRGTAPDAPPTSNVERKRRMACLEALYCLPGTVTRHLRAAVVEDTSFFSSDPLFASSEAWNAATFMAKDTHRDIAFAGHCVAAVLVAAWRLGFTAAPPGPPSGGGNGVGVGVGALAMHLDVPEAVAETWMNRADSVMLASLIHLLKNTLEDIREHDAAYLLPVEMHVGTTTTITAKTTSSGRAAGYRHQLLYTTLGLVNKFSPADAAGELLDAFVGLWGRVERLERETRERGYRSRGLEMVLRRMGPVLDRIPHSDRGPEPGLELVDAADTYPVY